MRWVVAACRLDSSAKRREARRSSNQGTSRLNEWAGLSSAESRRRNNCAEVHNVRRPRRRCGGGIWLMKSSGKKSDGWFNRAAVAVVGKRTDNRVPDTHL